MADETNVPAQPQAGGADPINPQPQAGETPQTDPQAGESQQKTSRSAEDYERMITELRKENAGHRTARKALEDEKRAREEADLSEKQKLEKRLAEQQQTHADFVLRTQDRLISSELRAQAAKLGFADPSDAVAMLNRVDLQFDEEGAPTNADALLRELLKAKPYLAGSRPSQTTGGGATNPGRTQTQTPSQLSWEYIGSLSPEQYKALSPEQKAAISRWQHENPLRSGRFPR